ncbi:MAG: hypothetical protein U0835_25255 [Isosphaeraceae bacterium]
MYLIHGFALNAAEVIAPPWTGYLVVTLATLVLATAASVLMAWVMAVTVERPCIAYGRRLAARLRDRSAAPAPTRLNAGEAGVLAD